MQFTKCPRCSGKPRRYLAGCPAISSITTTCTLVLARRGRQPSPASSAAAFSIAFRTCTRTKGDRGRGQIGPPLDAVAAAGQLRGGRGGEEGGAGGHQGGRARERLISTAGGTLPTARRVGGNEGQARETAVIRSAGWHRLGGGAVRVGHDAPAPLLRLVH